MTNYEKSLIEKLNKLIEEKYINSESITDDLCYDLGISRSNLYRILKDNFQLSPSLYIRKIKLKKAKQLLANSEMKIGEIAYFIGLDSPQNFTKYFTQEHGINPTEYRKKKVEVLLIEEDKTKEVISYQPIIKRKPKFKERFSYFVPGIVVVILTTLGFYIWQKNNFKEEGKITISPKYSIAFMPLECVNNVKDSKNCSQLNLDFYSSFSKVENISLVNEADSVNFNLLTNENKPNILYLLTGEVTFSLNLTQLKLQILDGNVEKTIWTNTYNLNPNNFQEEFPKIAAEISQILKENPKLIKNEKLYLIPTKNMITYRQYLQGNQLVFDWKIND